MLPLALVNLVKIHQTGKTNQCGPGSAVVADWEWLNILFTDNGKLLQCYYYSLKSGVGMFVKEDSTAHQTLSFYLIRNTVTFGIL